MPSVGFSSQCQYKTYSSRLPYSINIPTGGKTALADVQFLQFYVAGAVAQTTVQESRGCSKCILMMYWFLQPKMCSKRDVFYHSSAKQSFAQGVACDRHQIILVIVLPSPLENSYSLQQLWLTEPLMQVFKLLWIACFASFHIPSMLPVCTNSVLPSRLLSSRQKIPLLWLQE